jgi:hypothetical protein
MTIRNKFATAAVVVTLATFGVLYLLLPVAVWTLVSILSVIFVGLSLGAIVYLPSAFLPSSKTSAARLAGLGPKGVAVFGTLALAVAALVASIFDHPGLAWALLILSAAAFIVGMLMTGVVSDVVDSVQSEQQKDDRYRPWAIALDGASFALTDSTLKARCTKLAEELRYAPSARAADATSEAAAVSAALTALQETAAHSSTDEVTSALDRLQRLLASHTAALMALRSHA